MQKLSTAEAVKVITVSESTLRRDLKSGKLSFTTDKNNRKQIDVSELERVYGQLTISENQKERALTVRKLSVYSRGRCRT